MTTLRLGNPTATDPTVVGTKAARLSHLMRTGFSVPEGVVVPINAMDDQDSRALAEQVIDQLGGGPFAVRSSAVAEDLAGSSYAGLYETVLDVTGVASLAHAIDRCRDSADADRVRAYRKEAAPHTGVAVLVQRMVHPQAAGVAFSADPVSGDRGVTIVEAVAGLGDQLVAGAAEPQRFRVRGDGVLNRYDPSVLSEEQVRSVAQAAGQLAELFGCPQDVEWAFAGDQLWLLQARPITGLPDRDSPELVPIAIEAPPGTWLRGTVHSPRPPSPLATSDTEFSFPKVLAEFGVLIDVDFAIIGGWEYLQIRPVGAPKPRARRRPSRKPGTPPRWLLQVLFKLVPAIRRRIRAAQVAVSTDLSGQFINRWYNEWRPQMAAEVARLTELDLTTLTDDDLDRHVQSLWRLGQEWGHIHVRLGVSWSLNMYELRQACRELLEWDEAQMLELVSGLSTASTEPARQLARLARLAAERPAVRTLLNDIDDTTPGQLRTADAEFARAFDDYLTHYAARALSYEVMDPTLREDPLLLLRLVHDQLELGFDPAEVDASAATGREQAREHAHRLLESRPQADRDRFARALARAERAHPVREDNEWFTTSVLAALLRYAALEVGRRLAERQQIAGDDDVFMLKLDELRAALQDGTDQHQLVTRRRGQHAWAIANTGPQYYGPASPAGVDEPPFDLLPPAARLVNEAAMWSVALSGETGAPDRAPGDGIRGVAASAGRYTGPVRVITGEHQFDKMRPGDVVVCPVTSPVWSVLYPSMGALVTDLGGVLSHPAIIAREYGLPAVVGTEIATSTLLDGQLVTVDGSQGTVEIVTESISSPHGHAPAGPVQSAR